MFVGVHAMLAMQTKTPELAITEDEGKALMRAAQNVMRHYSVQTTQKTLDWVAFLGAAGGMYGTRLFAISVRRSAERAAKAAEGGNVYPWPHKPKSRPGPASETIPAETIGQQPYTPSVVAGGDEFPDGF